MNPIAFIAFLVGMNTTPNSAPPAPQAQELKKAEQTQPQPSKQPSTAKRGGWDRN